jgi:hypothetical protein
VRGVVDASAGKCAAFPANYRWLRKIRALRREATKIIEMLRLRKPPCDWQRNFIPEWRLMMKQNYP